MYDKFFKMKNINKFIISLVLPVYNESKNIRELYKRCCEVLKKYQNLEIIFIDDGSTDNSFELITEIAQKNRKNIKVIRFSRNFGHQIAITAGIDYASGDVVIIMDSDFQDPPEIIPEMIKKWEEGYEIVYAKRRKRKDSLLKKLTAYLFYRLLQKMANLNIPVDVGDFRLMDKKVVNALRQMREHSRFMRGLTSWVGFKQTHVLFDRNERKYGKTSYSFIKMIKFAIDGITSFSYIPLRIATYFGFLSALLGIIGIIYSLYWRIFLPERTISGWTTITIAVLFLGGMQLIILGIVGEYIGRIYTEIQNRPLYLISQKINFDK
jgi:dolichol-phosphate mannosyltransferase